MKIEELIQRKNKLQEESDRLGGQIRDAKVLVLKEIKLYIKEFDISFNELKGIFDELYLVTALGTTLAPKDAKKAAVGDRKGFKYHDAKNGKWYNGYTPIPKWFDLSKADQYLVKGQSHSSLVKKALSK